VPPEPAALLAVLLLGAVYARGVFTLWSRAGADHVVRRWWQAACFGGGSLAILVALESPVDTLSQDLFAVHMVQHLLLIVVAAPLVVLSAPVAPVLWAMPEASRRTVARWWRTTAPFTRPAVAFAAHSLALWLWHVPNLYEAAIRSRGTHIFEHLTFLITAVLFWWGVIHRTHRDKGVGVLYVFCLALQSTFLGALLTFSPRPWYSAHLATALAWGLTPLEDQQLAGLIMWVPGGTVYVAAALGLLASWLRSSSKASARSS